MEIKQTWRSFELMMRPESREREKMGGRERDLERLIPIQVVQNSSNNNGGVSNSSSPSVSPIVSSHNSGKEVASVAHISPILFDPGDWFYAKITRVGI